MSEFKDIKSKCDPKFKSNFKLPPMVDSPMTPSNPQAGYGKNTEILTREELAKML